MRFFFDTEFSERGPNYPIELISLGMVNDYDDDFLYVENADFHESRANDWVKANVLTKLRGGEYRKRPSEIGGMILHYVNSRIMNRMRYEPLAASTIWPSGAVELAGSPPEPVIVPDKPQFWAYYADYDWVVFCQLFGTMMNLPQGWPMYCNDLKQLADMMGNPPLPKLTLTDERWSGETGHIQLLGEHDALTDAVEVRSRFYHLQCQPAILRMP